MKAEAESLLAACQPPFWGRPGTVAQQMVSSSCVLRSLISYLRPISRVGRRLPAYSNALGKSLLAQRLGDGGDDGLSDHLPETLTPLTPYTIVERDALVRDLEETRERGYAIDRQENYVGVTCFAFPLRFVEPPFDAISCSVPIERLHEGREAEIVEALRRTKHSIERMAPVRAPGELPWV